MDSLLGAGTGDECDAHEMEGAAGSRGARGLGAGRLRGGLGGAVREFTGTVAAAGGSSITVDRGGDKVSFARTDATQVSGARSAWSVIAVGDRVSVSWKLEDKPPKAYRVRVLKAAGG